MALALQSILCSSPRGREFAPQNGQIPTGPLLRAVQDARANANVIFARPDLARIVDAIAAVARDLGDHNVYGGSVHGHMLVGALVSRWQEFSPWVPGATVDVLLIDGPLVGIAGLVHSAETAKAMGARRVDALSVGSGPELQSLANSAIDHLRIVNIDGLPKRITADSRP